jgi:2-succinyl-5-enolpyruvyl-6-hydroxy-3-cyclohexene-1-carboxylate synthase
MTIYQFPEDANRRSTGVATVEVNGWIIKARYTSFTLTLDTMAQRLTDMLTRFDWPDTTGTPTAAAFLQPCATPIEWTDAELAAKDEGQAIADAYFVKLGDFLASASLPTLMNRTNAEVALLAKSPTYCRAEEYTTHSIYRPVDATDRYILAYGDAGISMNVARSVNNKDADYRASYSDFSDTFTLPRFQSLPTPDQIVQLANEGRFLSKVDSAGVITIFTPKDKDKP